MTPSGGRFSHRVAVRRGEVRLIPALAVIAGAATYAALPHDLLFGPRWLTPAVELALLVTVVVVNPTRLTTETRWSRSASLALAAVLIVVNTVSVGLLIRDLTAAHPAPGRELLVAALQVWITNMIAFALLYWDLDAGGAVARLPSSTKPAGRHDFWFPQDDARTAELALGTDGIWMPVFVDYLYLSITNSVAFSPTDTLPLTSRAKLLMAVQSLAAIVLSLLVIARAVNVLR